MKLFLAAILLTIGCSSNAKMPGQDQAVESIWKTFDMSNAMPLNIEWVHQAQLNCGPKDGHFVGYFQPKSYLSYEVTNTCIVGETFPDVHMTFLAIQDDEAYSDTAMAHELYHEALYLKTGDADYQHLDLGFGPAYGHPYGLVDQAKDELLSLGM